MAFDEQRTHRSATGALLNLYVKKPAATPRAILQLNHGFAEHAARYARFADAMAARGYGVYAHDHRGHGYTTAEDAQPRMFARDDGVKKVLADVDSVHEVIGTEHPGTPVVTFGHSMGGLITLCFAMRYPQRSHALAVWNANFSAGLSGRGAQAVLMWERFRLGSDAASLLVPKLTFQAWNRKIAGARTPFDWLSRNPQEVDAYVHDPLCGWEASVSMWQDVFRLIFIGADDGNLSGIRRDIPVNLVGGSDDPSTQGGRSVQQLAARLSRAGFSNVDTTIYPDNRHESLNELNRDLVTANFASWVDRVAPAAPIDLR